MNEDEHGKITTGDTAMNASKTKGWVTNHYGAIGALREKENCEQRDFRIHSYRKRHSTSQAVYDLNYLINQLEFLQEHHPPKTQVRLSIGDNQPLLATASTDRGETSIVVLAPQVVPDVHKDFNKREQNLLGFEVECTEQGCWHDTYSNIEKAREAQQDHKYLEGHESKIYNAQGEQVTQQ